MCSSFCKQANSSAVCSVCTCVMVQATVKFQKLQELITNEVNVLALSNNGRICLAYKYKKYC